MAALVHELRHQAMGSSRPMPLVSWLAAPWRVLRSRLTDVASILAGRQSRRGALIAVVVGLTVAVTRTLHQGQSMAGEVLAFLGLTGVICPLVAAATDVSGELPASLRLASGPA